MVAHAWKPQFACAKLRKMVTGFCSVKMKHAVWANYIMERDQLHKLLMQFLIVRQNLHKNEFLINYKYPQISLNIFFLQ